jgi:hypothetical protein
MDLKDVETFHISRYTAEYTSNVKFVVFKAGGHLLIGLDNEERGRKGRREKL